MWKKEKIVTNTAYVLSLANQMQNIRFDFRKVHGKVK